MHRALLLPIVALAVGCPKSTPKADLEPLTIPFMATSLCVSTFPAEPPPSASDRDAVVAAHTALRNEDGEAAMAALEPAGEHPAVLAARALAVALVETPEVGVARFRDLGETYPNDACTQRTLAILTLPIDPAEAQRHAEQAWALAPDDAENGVVRVGWIFDPTTRLEVAREVLAKHPGDARIAFFVGMAHLELGDGAAALEHLEAARAGELQVDEAILAAAFLAGDLGAYVAAASRLGLPMGDGGSIGTADDPAAAYRSLLGYAEGQALVATFETSEGTLTCTLFPEQAPVTVANFVGLARGTQPWNHPDKGPQSGPLYDGTLLHRVIPEFMIQGGDPQGSGRGNPGYQFIDELHPSLAFDAPGKLAMANAGPNTNGSQFFVTEVPTPHLTGRHTIFGTCDNASVEVVKHIARLPRGEADRPETDVVLQSVKVEARPAVP